MKGAPAARSRNASPPRSPVSLARRSRAHFPHRYDGAVGVVHERLVLRLLPGPAVLLEELNPLPTEVVHLPRRVCPRDGLECSELETTLNTPAKCTAYSNEQNNVDRRGILVDTWRWWTLLM